MSSVVAIKNDKQPKQTQGTDKAAEKKPAKLSCEELSITHVVEVWKMIERLKKEKPEFDSGLPTINHLYEFMIRTPSVSGVLIKRGKKPVGVILGQAVFVPTAVYFVSTIYLEQPERGKGAYKTARELMKKKLERFGVRYFAQIGGAL